MFLGRYQFGFCEFEECIYACARQSLKGHIYAITQLIKNPHEEVEDNYFKNNIYQFQNKKQKKRLQQSSEVTPYDSQMFVYKLHVMTRFTHSDWLRAKM